MRKREMSDKRTDVHGQKPACLRGTRGITYERPYYKKGSKNMAYRLPTFNLLANVWTCDANPFPTDGLPTYTDVPMQKYIAPRSSWPVSPPASPSYWRNYHPPVQLRMPRVSPAFGPWPGWKMSCIECPAGSGQYYRPTFNDIQHEGFVNEYGLVIAVQCNAAGKTSPPAGMINTGGTGVDPCGIAEGGGSGGAAFLDQFSDTPGTAITAHTANTGETWITSAAGMGIDSTGLALTRIGTSATYSSLALWAGPGGTTRTETLTIVTPPSFAAGLYFGLLFRGSASSQWLGALVADDGTGVCFLELYHDNAGTTTGYGVPTSTFSMSTSAVYNLVVTDDGSNITASLYSEPGHTLVVSTSLTTSDNSANTYLGVWSFDDGTHPPVTFDNLVGTT